MKRALVICIFLFLNVFTQLRGTTYLIQKPEEVIRNAELIIEAEVKDISFLPCSNHNIDMASITLSVLQKIIGDCPSSIIIRRAFVTPDLKFLDTEWLPSYQIGERFIICLSPTKDGYSTIGLYNGQFVIEAGNIKDTRIRVADFIKQIIDLRQDKISLLSAELLRQTADKGKKIILKKGQSVVITNGTPHLDNKFNIQNFTWDPSHLPITLHYNPNSAPAGAPNASTIATRAFQSYSIWNDMYSFMSFQNASPFQTTEGYAKDNFCNILWADLGSQNIYAATFTYPNDLELLIFYGPNSNTGVDIIFNNSIYGSWYFNYTPPQSRSSTQVDFIETLAHELGHAVGFDHNYWDTYSIMFPVYESRSGVVRSTTDGDRAGFIYQHTLSPLNLSGNISQSLDFAAVPNRIINLTSNVNITSGVQFKIEYNVSELNLGQYYLKVLNTGIISITEGFVATPDIRIYQNGLIKGLYPTIQMALSAASSGQLVNLQGNYSLIENCTVPDGVTFIVKSNVNLALNDYSISTSGGTITVESGATLSPDIRLQTGSTINGLYSTISAAFSAASDGQSVHIRGTHNFADHFTIPSGKILKTESNAQLNFASGKYLYVYGTLNAYNTTYTASSGTWGGIRFYSGSSGSLQYANINNATYGVYANNSNPTISHSAISNCSYGVYSYYGSPTLSNNSISSCTYGAYLNHAGNAVVSTNAITSCTRGIYGYYAGLSDFVDNYITSGGASRVAGIQVYNTTEPTVYNNTIEGSFTYGLDADHYSRPLAIGPSSQDYQGYNRIIGGQTATVYIHDHSESVLGTCFSSDGYAGYNTIYLDIQTDRFAHIRAENYANIIAQKNYWGDYPPSDFYADGTSSIDYSYPLSSDPGGGSSLAKILGGLLADALYFNILPFKDEESVESLWLESTELWQSLQYRKALDNCNTLLQNYPDSPYAPLAFLRSVYAKRALKSTDMEDHLQKYVDTKNLRTMALELLIGEDLSNQRFKAAIEKSKTVIKENPDTEAEYKAMFGLFNLYATDLDDKENARTMLDAMKEKYTDYGLTQMAQFEMGETVDWQLAKPIAFRKEPEPEVVSILPDKFQLKPNYPNPFNPSTNISFALPEESSVQITIFDLTGREIWRSVKSNYPAGNYTITWNGVNQSGANVVSGIYIVRMITPKYTATHRIVLMK